MKLLLNVPRNRLLKGVLFLAIAFVCLGLINLHPTGGDSLPVQGRSILEREVTAAVPDFDWPNLFGPTHDSQVAEYQDRLRWDSSGPPVVWRKMIGGGYSSPVVWGDHLIVLHRQHDSETIECLSAATGVKKWEYRYPTQFACPVNYSNGPYSTPVIDGHHVFAIGAEGQLHALRLADGTLSWRRNLLSEFDAPSAMFPFGSSPLLEGDRVIVAIGGRRPNGGIAAFDRETGRTVWTATEDRRGYATPVAKTIHGQRHVFVLTHESLLSLDARNGNVRWRIPFRPKNPDFLTATTPVVYEDLVFASAYQVGAMCLRILPDGSYQKVWSDRRSLDSQHNNLICRDGCVIGFSAREHVLGCVDLRTGEWRWKWKSELDRGCLLSLSDQLLVFSETGQLAMLSIGTTDCEFSSLTGPLLQGPCFSAPAICGRRLYLRNETDLVCFDIRPGRTL